MAPVSDEVATRLASEGDLRYIVALQRKNRESVGHLPTPAIEDRLRRSTLSVLLLNGEPCGYLLYDYRDSILRIPQACIQYDARRKHHGESLFLSVLARYPDVEEVRLRCAADIEANVFWRSLGFSCTSVQNGGRRRGRLINNWVKQFGGRLFPVSTIATTPALQTRVDCRYDETDFMDVQLEGFRTMITLPKLAWSNRKDEKNPPYGGWRSGASGSMLSP